MWALIAVPYLLVTTRAIRPAYEWGVEASILLLDLVAIAFCCSVNGPMQLMMDDTYKESNKYIAGRLEISGLMGLILLE